MAPLVLAPGVLGAEVRVSATADYHAFIASKSQGGQGSGFAPVWMPDVLFDFQAYLTDWNLRMGRSATFADCGLGKTLMQLVWSENVVRHTNGRVLILAPLAVGHQTVGEAAKFGIGPVSLLAGGAALDPQSRIHVTNYERLHQVDTGAYDGVVCDESSILKSYDGVTRKHLTRFLAKKRYRLLCTATPSPNDYAELGTSAEALGELSHTDMLRRFFTQLDDKGQRREISKQQQAEKALGADPNYYRKLSFRVAQTIGQYRLRHHAVTPFWRWVCSWARAVRRPSDLGFLDGGFRLPPLEERVHALQPSSPQDGMLFTMPARGLYEERAERKRTLAERCEFVARLVDHGHAAVVWCHTNAEGDQLAAMIPGAEQVAGRTPDERKVELYEAFAAGELRVLVIKPKIGAWGLNWQHCAHVVTFATHSYEQYYQQVRRCWRFGQENPVRVDVVATEGEVRVVDNLRAKAARADRMFDVLINEMSASQRVERCNPYTVAPEVPAWL